MVVEAMETLQGHVRVEVDMGRLNEGTEEVVKGWACVADLRGEKEGQQSPAGPGAGDGDRGGRLKHR